MITMSEVGIILLAAGRSSRFEGGGKLLTDYRGAPLVAAAAGMLAGLKPASLVAVCGPDAEGVRAVLEPMSFRIVENPEPGRGLSSSLAIGLDAVRDRSAALICLADMPAVTAVHVAAMLERFDPVSAPVVASSAAGIISPPAIIAQHLFPALLALQGDRGARDLIASGILVEAAPGELRDIDTIADLRSFAAGDPDICRG